MTIGPKSNDRLSKAEQNAARSLARLGKLQAKADDSEKKKDTKRKVLLGAALETMMKKDTSLRARFESFMRDFLKRPVDLEAFDFGGDAVNYFDRLAHDAAIEAESTGPLSGAASKEQAPKAPPRSASTNVGAPSNGSSSKPSGVNAPSAAPAG
ncbi:MAG TPA: hypothetical protein VFX59_10690 [Polyangiales bacterium]|nr:hypothetical protein [Polyangiales bacterium]